ncbi:hypothetical protein N0V88_002118 [Collariella sp. IMI 366227]|nr:hypothetical protein N0V88_002118 [Collariella sp. IMI 366227]
MNITKKFDRAFQWAGEKMGGEAKTTMSEDFKMMETEMALRFEGMERLQRSMNQYIKWMGRRLEPAEDREKGLPVGFLGRTMVGHGEEFQADSESLAMMKEYQNARKKLENRRLNYDASISKQQKAKRDDFRLEEELRGAKAKYEESSEDVLRRMQDVQDAESDSVRDLTHFLDAEIDYHERCADELRRVRQNWPGHASPPRGCYSPERRPTVRRSNTGHSFTDRLSRTNTFNNSSSIPESYETEPAPPVRMPIRTQLSRTFSHNHQQQQADGPAPAPPPPRHRQYQAHLLPKRRRPHPQRWRAYAHPHVPSTGLIRRTPPPPPSRASKPKPPVPARREMY